MKNKIVIATIKPWNISNALKFKDNNLSNIDVYIISKKEDLNIDFLNKIRPDYIFFPHWSWIIPEHIYKNFESIVFHMTDLPYGRGGSPLQNLIVNKMYNTKISAIKVEKDLDAGPIYIKRDFYVGLGSAQEIYRKISDIIFSDMIPYIIKNGIIPKIQEGEPTFFSRRTPEQSDLSKAKIENLNDLYDFIRMLDAQSYPKAFLDFKEFKMLFSDVCIKDGKLVGHFEIDKK